MRTLSTYIKILRTKGIRYSIQEGWRAVWPLWFTTDKAVKNIIHQRRVCTMLRRKYLRYATDFDEVTADATVPRIIWICWLQGLADAPAIVQRCVKSVRDNCPTFEVRILTEGNMLDYVDIPADIIARWRSGRMPFAHFSDILRVSLLAQHGGIWMDATVLMTGPMPDYVTQGPLFMFRSSWLDASPHVGSNWMLAASANHPVMRNMRALLIEYWRHEGYLRDYLIFHDLLAVMYAGHAQTRRCIDAMPYVCNADPHTLVNRLFEPWSEALWSDVCRVSAIHKLSYKLDKRKTANAVGTLYNHILGQ